MDYTQFLDSNSINWDYTKIMDICKISYILDRFSIKENDKILDVGTGTGMLIPFVHQHNPKGNIKGVDKSINMIEIAKEKFKNTLFSLSTIKTQNKYYKKTYRK